jgi:hypothetical protein
LIAYGDEAAQRLMDAYDLGTLVEIMVPEKGRLF